MPSPVGHSLTGYLICCGTSQDASRLELRTLFLFCVCSILPDLDFIPGFLMGEPNRFHHGISHSLGFALGFGLLMSCILFFMKDQRVLRNFVIFFTLYFSHVLLDSLCEDSSPPYGVPALWPITGHYYISPISVFLDIQRDQVSGTFIRSLFSFHNFLAILIEIVIFLPLVVIVSLFKINRVRIVGKVFHE
jgi:inner membrane protein